jgi:hypothetical protein
MGATIQFESHRVELPFVYEMEHDPEVLEYYDQPPSIPLAYKAGNGRRLSVLHTPDYFVLRHDSAGWEECKTADELEKLAVKSPNRYRRGNKGNWCCRVLSARLRRTEDCWSPTRARAYFRSLSAGWTRMNSSSHS